MLGLILLTSLLSQSYMEMEKQPKGQQKNCYGNENLICWIDSIIKS